MGPNHSASIVLGVEKTRLEVPALLKPPVVQLSLQESSTQTSSNVPRIPVPFGMLLKTDSNTGKDMPDGQPFGSILSPTGGTLIYGSKDANGGVTWKEAVAKFFHTDKALAAKAEKVLKEYEDESAKGRLKSDRPLAALVL